LRRHAGIIAKASPAQEAGRFWNLQAIEIAPVAGEISGVARNDGAVGMLYFL
jgi:hypothetical protein